MSGHHSWQAFLAECEERKQRHAGRPLPVRAAITGWRKLRFTARNLVRPRPWHRLRWRWQRSRRGWADPDTWSLDGYLARLIGESIEHLRRYGHGFPNGMTSEEWDELLGHISGPLLAYEGHWEHVDGETPAEWQDRQEGYMGAAEGSLSLLADVLPCLHCQQAQESVRVLARNLPDMWD